jgi:hypothetical protein
MLLDTGIDDVKKQSNAEYAKHINDPVLSSLKMEGIRLLLSKEFQSNIKFHENPFSGGRAVPSGQADTIKLTVVFRNFAKAPNSRRQIVYMQLCCMTQYNTQW